MCAPQGLQNMDAYTILQSIVEAIMQRLHKEITLSKKKEHQGTTWNTNQKDFNRWPNGGVGW